MDKNESQNSLVLLDESIYVLEEFVLDFGIFTWSGNILQLISVFVLGGIVAGVLSGSLLVAYHLNTRVKLLREFRLKNNPNANWQDYIDYMNHKINVGSEQQQNSIIAKINDIRAGNEVINTNLKIIQPILQKFIKFVKRPFEIIFGVSTIKELFYIFFGQTKTFKLYKKIEQCFIKKGIYQLKSDVFDKFVSAIKDEGLIKTFFIYGKSIKVINSDTLITWIVSRGKAEIRNVFNFKSILLGSDSVFTYDLKRLLTFLTIGFLQITLSTFYLTWVLFLMISGLVIFKSPLALFGTHLGLPLYLKITSLITCTDIIAKVYYEHHNPCPEWTKKLEDENLHQLNGSDQIFIFSHGEPQFVQKSLEFKSDFESEQILPGKRCMDDNIESILGNSEITAIQEQFQNKTPIPPLKERTKQFRDLLKEYESKNNNLFGSSEIITSNLEKNLQKDRNQKILEQIDSMIE